MAKSANKAAAKPVQNGNKMPASKAGELRALHEQLSEALGYSEVVLDNLRESLLVMDGDLRIKKANPSFYQLFQLERKGVEGKLIFEIGDGTWDIPRLRDLLENMLAGKKTIRDFEIKHAFPDLGERVLLMNVQSLTGRTHSQDVVLLAIEDISGQTTAARLIAEREENLKNIVNTIPVMMWVADPDKRRTFFNKTWLQFTGNRMRDDLGMGWLHSVHKDDQKKFMKLYSDSFDKRRPYQIDYRLRRHDGEYLWITSSGKPTFGPDGGFTGFIGICTEINEKVMLSDRLEKLVRERTLDLSQANESLARTNQSLEQYAFVASHDMQEPLRKIQTFGNILNEEYGDKLPAEVSDYISRINKNAERMSQLINDLLSFSRLGEKDESFTDENLNGIVENVLTDFDMLMTQKDARVTVGKLPTLHVSRVAIRQLFYNLISNALKFSPADTAPRITISARAAVGSDLDSIPDRDKKKKYQLIEVSDNGIGFDQKYAEKIFQIFQRLNTKDAYTGSGIGLAIVKRIVESHHGYVSVTSAPGKGTKFSILLPR